jgi:3-methyladenine DNA glycosylase AlkD
VTGPSKPPDAASVRRDLEALADPERAAWTAPYLGVVPGGYGEGDTLLGITVPEQRRVARAARDLPLPEAAALLASPVHEHRFVAVVVLTERHKGGGRQGRRELSRFYLDHRAGVDNWDLVDASAPEMVGVDIADGEGDRAVLDQLAASERLWDRRIAIVATHALIRRGELDETFALAVRLMDDPHHLIHKPVGWMLREAGKRDEAAMVAFLEAHRAELPRTTLRYAIERLTPARRAALMARP